MRIVRPYAIQDGDLTTNATESVAAWSSVTAYTTGQTVSYGHKVWEAVQNGTNKQPDISPLFWFELRPTNPWAMFDNKTGTQTVRGDDLTVTVDVTGYADTVGLLNISAASLNITVMDGVTEVFNEDISLVDNTAVVDYYEYFFEPIIRLTEVVRSITPDIPDPSITVTLEDAGQTVKAGHLVIGKSRYIGEVQYGATIGIIDYSRIEEDDFGNTYIVERGYNRRGRFNVWLTKSRVNSVYNIVSALRATPVLIIATEKYNSTLYFGLLREAEIEIAYPNYSIMSVEVRGL